MACTASALANATDVCAYARSACAETGAGIFGSYITLWHCEMGGAWGWFLPLSAWLVVLIYALGTTADVFLIPQLAYLSTLLKLSPDVAGVTLLALGNGAPDVFTGIAVATQRGESLDFSLLLSDIVGGSVFIMTVVVGAVVWIANRHEPGWRVEKVPFWRDVVGLIIALTAVAAVAADGTVVLWESLSFLGLYVLYVLVVLCLPALLRCCFAGAAAAGAAGLGTRWQQPLLPAGPHAAGPHAQPSECARHAAPSALTSAAASAVPPLMMARPGGADPAVRPADEEAEVATAAVVAVEAAAAAATLEPIELAERPRMGDDEVGRLQRAEWLPPPPVRRTAVSRAGRHPMAGLDWEPGARGCCGLLSTVLWSASLPLAALRWASIPSSDGLWDRRRRLWTLATPPVGALLMLLQVEGSLASAAGARLGGSPLPVAALLLLLGALGSGGLWWATSATAAPRGLSLLVGCGFVQTIAWLNLLAQEMIALIEATGILLGISTSILGLTVIAFGNSVGDLVADSAAARGADARMAMAACFGSPLLMNILGVGVSLSLRMLVTGGKPVAGVVSQQCRLAYCFLYLALLSHVVTFPCGGFRAPRAYAVYLFALYGVFMLLACLAETGALDLAFLGVGAG